MFLLLAAVYSIDWSRILLLSKVETVSDVKFFTFTTKPLSMHVHLSSFYCLNVTLSDMYTFMSVDLI